MLVAVFKAKVKVRANFSDRIIELSNLTLSVVGCVEIVNCLKRWDEKKNRKLNVLLNEMACNSRGRSLSAGKWLEGRLALSMGAQSKTHGAKGFAFFASSEAVLERSGPLAS
ncbi:MAG: hypothetical protein JRJ79_01095 [Deltaproteobacteria bacterium]|nr:hypothetical protein [Deltaproteobacteria bacterium]